MKKIFFCSIFSTSLFSSTSFFEENLYPEWKQTIKINQSFIESKSESQEIQLFENSFFGKVLCLDGVVQATEKDEFIYHETLVNIPYFTHGNIKSVLVIGGGDGGIIRELFKHKDIEKVTLVELDPEVINFSKSHLQFISHEAFYDPRLSIQIQDGFKYIQESTEYFDLIICDSCDPIGPAECLFTKEFYSYCKKRLNPKGIFVNQAGVPFIQEQEFIKINKNLKEVFNNTDYFFAAIPTYIGGLMAFGFASDNFYDLSKEPIESRHENCNIEYRYYTPEIHKASFVKPKFIKELINE